ncbi:MAG: adventurous gliding motility protein CglE [Deltaproteobacteria bacterium]|nr:adventurous gliding motility protein CglE [Deltaproteobacteria bacterium]
MTRLLLVVPFALLLAPSFAHASGGVSEIGDLPRFELRPTGLLLAAKKKKPDPKEAASSSEPVGDALDDPPPEETKKSDGEEVSTALPDAEVKVGGTVLGQSVGGATGFVFKQGIYTQSDLGGFFVLGNSVGSPTGFTISQECGGPPCKPVPTSQLQPYIGLSVGYDILQWLGVQLSFGTGFVANAAVYGDSIENPRDYGLTNINLAVVGSFYVLERLAIMGKLMGGASFLSPEPAPGEPTIGGNGGLGIGVRYATLLPDVFVGIDGNFVLAFIPSSGGPMVIIPGFSFAPVIKYVF